MENLVEKGLEFYRKRKGPEPTYPCVRNGESCSQRFQGELEKAILEGKSSLDSTIRALNVVISACSEINETTKEKAVVTWAVGTAAALTGISIGVCNCPGDLGHEYRNINAVGGQIDSRRTWGSGYKIRP